MARLIVAVYEELSTAKLVARTLEAAGVPAAEIDLVAGPSLVPTRADLTTRDHLMTLGVPETEAQIFADLVQGGAVLITARVTAETEDHAYAALDGTRPGQPLAIFEVAATDPTAAER